MSRPDRRAVQRRKHLRKRPPKASRARRGGSAKDLDTLCDNIGNEVFAPRIPPMLWHYTPKWEGLAGILRSRKLWATDYRHQRTDEFEFRHADKAILQLAEELAADDSLSAWHHARVEAWLQRLRTDPWANAAERLFITSFCERGDNADVWREFAAAHSGFAIEFELLCDEEVEGLDFGLIVMQVDYDEAAVTSRLRHLVLKILETSQRYPAENRDAADRVTERQLWFLGMKAAIQYKGAKHAADCEWRRVATPHVPELILDSDGPRRLEVPLRCGVRIPKIRTVRIGALADANAEARLAEFFEKHGYAGEFAPLVERCPLPVR